MKKENRVESDNNTENRVEETPTYMRVLDYRENSIENINGIVDEARS